MERGNGFDGFGENAKFSPELNLMQSNDSLTNPSNGGNNTTVNVPADNGRTRAAAPGIREQDQYMPIANVIRIMRRILPAHAKISDDAKETIQECVSEYISFITGEANDRCQREQRKTITAEDVIWAMGKLGFDDYVQPLTVFVSRYREIENDRTSLRGDPIVKSSHSGGDFGPIGIGSFGPQPPPPPQPSQQGFMMGHHGGVYDPVYMGGYYRDGSSARGSGASGSGASGSGSSPNALIHNYDPYGYMGKMNGQ